MQRTFLLFSGIFGIVLSGVAANHASIYESVKPILDQQRDQLPAELKSANESKWNAWSRRQNQAIRLRLRQGDLDSMVNLLLFGTSFTSAPRIGFDGDGILNATRSGTLNERISDFLTGLRNPGKNERLAFLSSRLRAEGVDLDDAGSPAAGKFLYENLQRVLEERRTLAARLAKARAAAASAAAPDTPAPLKERSQLFRDRGVSLDTTIFPNFSIDMALRDLKNRGALSEGQVGRVAVVGPGLDFIDKEEGFSYDYYPQQTLQPFALYDSLVRVGLAKPRALSISVFDISPRVIDHLQRARERARKNMGYIIQLPHDTTRSKSWPAELTEYWRSFGDQAGAEVTPIRPPQIFRTLETRAVRIRPDVVLACEPADLNIVLERVNLAAKDRFDIVVGTNIFTYYGALEQALALENAGAMLKPGGFLLTNDQLPESGGGAMRQMGVTNVQFDAREASPHDAIVWYKKVSPTIAAGLPQ